MYPVMYSRWRVFRRYQGDAEHQRQPAMSGITAAIFSSDPDHATHRQKGLLVSDKDLKLAGGAPATLPVRALSS